MIKKLKKVKRATWEYVVSLIIIYIIGAHHSDTAAYISGTSYELKGWVDWLSHSPIVLISLPVILQSVMRKKYNKDKK